MQEHKDCSNSDVKHRVSVSFGSKLVLIHRETASEADDISRLLKQTEFSRRERQRRLFAGDETARLKIAPDAMRSTMHVYINT